MNIAMYINDILSCRSGENNFSLYKKALFILKKHFRQYSATLFFLFTD